MQPALTEAELAADTVRRLSTVRRMCVDRDGAVHVHDASDDDSRTRMRLMWNAHLVFKGTEDPRFLLVEKNREGRTGRHARGEVEAIVHNLFSDNEVVRQRVLDRINLEFPE